ncbi:uncharacterized protein LOC121379942 isoform X2 [Gigantopelta aegis]|uniref:uncharacterized protein LOC121379942 isoform X2 n=1 Tax=Gigantopelta aegis TaxID=1735272 RepID=UPI001B8891FF|nr:uncharacterized protein LOC121379942 isoform X2 [Gigantopelta aegis]
MAGLTKFVRGFKGPNPEIVIGQQFNNKDDPFRLGKIVSGDSLGFSLHDAAIRGNAKQLKSVLKRGIYVDYPNDSGQTPLFCACYANQERAAEILLKNGANPNEKSNDGTTPVHATCYNGNINLLVSLIKAGGDLRLHDKDGKTANHWADLQPDAVKRFKMMEFLEKSHLFAMTHSGGDLSQKLRAQASNIEKKRSIFEMIRKKVEKVPSLTFDPLRRVNSTGFGCVYVGNDDQGAIVSTIPLVSESQLQHDPHGITYQNGAFLAMESMTWNHSAVTVKRLQQESQPGAYIDLLISEMGNMGKIRHQNILLLMGVCQTNSLDSMVLVFERVGLGSLYYYLHQRLERLPTQNIRDILLQICSALVFIHNQNFIHCSLSSHAVNLVNPYLAKIGNLEYMIESTKARMGKQSNVSVSVTQNSMYNWMAPELMLNQPPSQASDIYSYCCIIWEMFECEVPWDMRDSDYIKNKLTKEKVPLKMENSKIPQPFKAIADYGLHLDAQNRQITFEQINQWICAPPDQVTIPDLPSVSEPKPKRKIISVSPEDFSSEISTSGGSQSPKSPAKKFAVDNMGNTVNSKSSDGKSSEHSSLKQRYEATIPPETSRNSDQASIHLNENHNYGPWDMHEQWMISYPKPDSSTESLTQDSGSEDDYYVEKYYSPPKPCYQADKSGYKFTRFCTDKSDWTCEIKHRQEGDRFGYAAEIHKVVKPENKVKSILYAEVEGIKKREAELMESHNTSPVLPYKPQIFSYMSLNRETGDRNSCVCKPATHCVEPSPPKSNSLKLSSAGSLYALYNAGSTQDEIMRQHLSPSLPQICKKMHDSLFSTSLDETDDSSDEDEKGFSEQQQKQWSKPDPTWYGGKGSVKNLVNVFQDHVEDHLYQQSVLQGVLASCPTKHDSGDQKHMFHEKMFAPNDFTKNNIEDQMNEMDLASDEMSKQPEALTKSFAEEKSKEIEFPYYLSGSFECSMEHESDMACQTESDLYATCTDMDSANDSSADAQSECPDLTIVTNTTATPTSNSMSESCISVDSVLLDAWIHEELERLLQELIKEQAEKLRVENFSPKMFYHLDGNNEETTKEIIKNLEVSALEDKNAKRQNVNIEEWNCCDTVNPAVCCEYNHDNREWDNHFATKLDPEENTQTGSEIADHPYKRSMRESDGSLLKEVMEELSRSQAKRKARQRIQRNEFDLQEYYIDDDDIEKSGLKLDGARQQWAVPRPASEPGMSNRSEKSVTSRNIPRTREVSCGNDRVTPNICPKPTIARTHSERKAKHKSKGYTTTVTVASSLDRPGEHKLKHTATDLDTGEMKTLHEQRILARSVISTINPH